MQMSRFDPVTIRQARIGHSLREVYERVTASPLPDQFEALLNELDAIPAPTGTTR